MKKVLFILIILMSCNLYANVNPNLFRLAFFALNSETVPDTVVRTLENEIKEELKATSLFTMIPQQEIDIANRNTTLFDRGNTRSYLKLGRRVGADKILFGSVNEDNRVYKLKIIIMDIETRKIDREISLYRDAIVDSLNTFAPAVTFKFYYPDNDTGYSNKKIWFVDNKDQGRTKFYKISTPIFMASGLVAAIIGKRVVSSDFLAIAKDSIEYKFIDEKTTNNRAVFDLSGFSAKASAMADAYTAIGDGPTGFIYNPATLPYIESRSAGFSFSEYTGFNDNYSLRTISMGYSDRIIDNHFFGNALFYTGGDGLMDELTFITGYGTSFNDIWVLPDFTLGANFKFRSLKFGDGVNSYGLDRVKGNAWGLGFDVGGTAQFTKELRGGMSFSDLYNILYWNNSLTDRSYNEPLPRELKMGLVYNYNAFFMFSMDWFKSVYADQSEAFAFGANWEPFSFLAFRAGWFQDAYQYDRNRLTAGLGVNHLFELGLYGKYNVGIDYSFEYFSILYNKHTFSLNVDF